jgi:hypothetical protein
MTSVVKQFRYYGREGEIAFSVGFGLQSQAARNERFNRLFCRRKKAVSEPSSFGLFVFLANVLLTGVGAWGNPKITPSGYPDMGRVATRRSMIGAECRGDGGFMPSGSLIPTARRVLSNREFSRLCSVRQQPGQRLHVQKNAPQTGNVRGQSAHASRHS